MKSKPIAARAGLPRLMSSPSSANKLMMMSEITAQIAPTKYEIHLNHLESTKVSKLAFGGGFTAFRNDG